MKLQKCLTLILAVMFIFTATLSVAASVGDSFSHTSWYNGDPVIWSGNLHGQNVTASITRYISDSSPADNYSTGIVVQGKNSLGGLLWTDSTKNALPYSVITTSGSSKKVLPKATCKFYIDPPMDPAISLLTLTPNYADDLSID